MDDEDFQVEQTARVIRAVADIVPAEVEKDFPPHLGMNTCILSTRCGFDVLKHYGIPKRALPVSVSIFNRALVKRIGEEGRYPFEDEVEKEWFRQDGSWGLQVGRTGVVAANQFDGHLVLVAYPKRDDESDGVLIDLSLQQSSRPHKKIRLEPLVGTLPKNFINGANAYVTSMNDCVLRYQHLRTDAWQVAADWQDQVRRKFIVMRTISKIDTKLAAYAA